MSTPFQPARIVGGSVVVEDQPFHVDGAAHHRGVELLEPPGSARRVVVHELGAWLADDEHHLRLFERTAAERVALEGTPAPRLLHALGRDGRVHAMVLEHLEGSPLDDIVAGLRERGEPVPVEVALAIARELAPLWSREATPALYLGLRDVRVDHCGHVRALPQLSSERARQAVGAAVAVIETPLCYLAPEVLRGDEPGRRSAVYMLGMLLYELLAGRMPYAEGTRTTWEIVSRIVKETLPPLDALRPGVSPVVTGLVHRMVAREPAERFASWSELTECLDAVQSIFGAGGREPLAAWARSLPDALRPVADPPLDLAALEGWPQLPHAGLVPVAVPWQASAPSEPARAETFVDPDLVYPGRDGRPMLAHDELLVDARPVTIEEYERFAIATSLVDGAGIDEDFGEHPRTGVSFEQARAYARWAGKRLPSDDEWTTLIDALGVERLGAGEVWEWTATSMGGGHLVRGGRRREAPQHPPSPDDRMHQVGPADDVGFRCVMDRGDAV